VRNLLLATAAVLLLSGLVFGEIPQVMGYQGRVTDNGGNPVADGNYTMRFQIYDDATAGSLLWDSNDQSVAVSGGVFSVELGESPQPNLALTFDQDYWLLVTYDGEAQTPRRRLGSVGYAYMASGLVPGTEVAGAVSTGDSAVFKATNTATTGWNWGLHGEAASPEGDGVHGRATATTGNAFGGTFVSACQEYGGGAIGIAPVKGLVGMAMATTGNTYGVRGRNQSTDGCGVLGQAIATTGDVYGIHGTSASDSGRGILGEATATGGETYGVYGTSASTEGSGLFGEGPECGVHGVASGDTGWIWGVFGESHSPNGDGVHGVATATTGPAAGGSFMSSSAEGYGVVGWATATTGMTRGVLGWTDSPDGRGVCGKVFLTTGINYGVYGLTRSTSGRGVYGRAEATEGETFGGKFVSASGTGTGVHGYAYATADTNYGVYGQTDSPDGYGVYYSGGLAGTGAKSCVVRTSRGPTLLYCQESPECWFEDFGEGQLIGGRARIELDPLFLETVTIDEDNPMKVFVELDDKNCNGVAISRGATGFDVVERHDGESTCRFWYRVVAKRRGFDGRRLEVCGAARTDPYLYPELRRAEPAELDGEREDAIAAHRRSQQRSLGRSRGRAHIAQPTSDPLGKPVTR
jgi:hypothetical protein